MSREVLITTPENIAIEYELAGLGTRFLASVLDIVIQIAIGLIVTVLWVIVEAILSALKLASAASFMSDVGGIIVGVWFIAIFLLIFGYYIFFEIRWNGQTIGKRQLGLRVIREGGYPVRPYNVFIRNLVRVLDFMPVFYLAGVISILATKNYQRVGDIIAGTIVVKQRAPQSLDGLLRIAHITPEHLDPAALAIVARQADRLSPDEYRAVRHFTERRRQLSLEAQQIAAIKVAVPLMQRLRIVPPLGASAVNYADFLEYLAVAYEMIRRPK